MHLGIYSKKSLFALDVSPCSLRPNKQPTVGDNLHETQEL